jgi:LysM repeat protein
MFFILLPITIFSIYNYLSKEKGMGAAEEAGAIETGFETVGYETNDTNKGTTIEVRKDNIASESTEPENSTAQGESTAYSEKASQKEDSEAEGSAAQPEQEELPKAAEKSAPEKAAEPKKQEEPKTEGKIVYHTVKPKETIFRIAMTYYKSQAGIDIIKKANNLQSNEIKTGQVLQIPLD